MTTPTSMPAKASFTRTRSEFFTAIRPEPEAEERGAYHPATAVRLSVQKRSLERHAAGKHHGKQGHWTLDCLMCNPCRECASQDPHNHS